MLRRNLVTHQGAVEMRLMTVRVYNQKHVADVSLKHFISADEVLFALICLNFIINKVFCIAVRWSSSDRLLYSVALRPKCYVLFGTFIYVYLCMFTYTYVCLRTPMYV